MNFIKSLIIFGISLASFAGGTGFAQMNVVIKNFPIKEVQELLPKELILKPYRDTPKDRHPIIFYFSKQNKVSGEFKKFPTAPYIGTFSEFAIAIANVEHIDIPGKKFKYHNIIYLNSRLGILTAKPYKLRKLYMDLESNSESFKSTKDAANLIEAQFYPTSTKYDASVLKELISQDSIAYSTDKKFRCSSIEWKNPKSKVYFNDADVIISRRINSSLASDISVHTNQFSDSIEGSFYYEDRWYLRMKSCFE